MNKRTALAVAATVALGAAAAAGAAGTGLLHLTVGSSPSASGIVVHGRWHLVVRDSRGKVVAHRRFENALVSSGQCVLTSLLLGGTLHGFVQGTPCQMEVTREDGATFASYTTPGVVGAQAVELDDGTTPNSFKGCNLLFDRDLCFLAHNNGDASAISGGPTPPVGDGPLHVAATGSSMTLAGSISLPVATTFTQVSTLLKVCGAYDAGASFKEQDPHDCADADGNYSWWTFTSKTLSPPLSVAPGQSVAVSVQLSFS